MSPFELLLAICAVTVAVAIIVRQVMAIRDSREISETNRFAAEIIENAGEGIVVFDREHRYVLWNRFMEEMTGLPAESVLGRRFDEVFPHAPDEPVGNLIDRALEGRTVLTSDIHYSIAETGREGWVSAVYRPHVDLDGNIVGVTALIRDITERKAAEQQIEYQAYHDALTGLANRRLFQEHLSLALAFAQRRGSLVAVLFLDLDHFKIVNDSLGHSVGDALLRHVAARLKTCVREGDSVARVGGDEFTVVLQEIARRDDAEIAARKVLRTLSEPLEVLGHRLFITASIGITLFPDHGPDAETLLREADAAMYQAKADGRNRYQLATADLSRSTRERMRVENGLHEALAAGEFVIHYQPQVEAETMAIIGAEALLRWQHPLRGLLLPEHFIGFAEDRGLILEIGEWVLREGCRTAREFQALTTARFRISVNLSPRQFRDPDLLTMVRRALADAELDPHSLELEITETVAMENVELTMTTLRQLRESGVSIAIDDFGTGHSSLAYLKRFPLDALKIDRTFVTDLPDKFEDAAIVSSVISLANGLGLRVVAEGVETREQLEFLRENGCREVQGFLFSQPLPAEELIALLGRAKDVSVAPFAGREPAAG